MSEDFMEGLFNNELTPSEYDKIIKYCQEQLKLKLVDLDKPIEKKPVWRCL